MRNGTGCLGQLFAAVTVFTLNTLVISVAGLLRLLPVLLPVLARLAWGAVLLSFRLYHLLLRRAAPVIKNRWGINILDSLWRVVATTLLSLVLGLTIFLFVSFPVNPWTILLLLGHGLFVGLTWNEISQGEELTTGVRIQ